jgi:hypothetical protein
MSSLTAPLLKMATRAGLNAVSSRFYKENDDISDSQIVDLEDSSPGSIFQESSVDSVQSPQLKRQHNFAANMETTSQQQYPKKQFNQRYSLQQQQSKAQFNGFKVYSRHDIGNVNLRTGYFGGKLVLRVSNGVDIATPEQFSEDESNSVTGYSPPPSYSSIMKDKCLPCNYVMLDSREFKILQREFVNMCSMLTISDKKKGQYMYLDETLKTTRPDQVKKVTFVNAEKVIITSENRSNNNNDNSMFEEAGRVVLASEEFFQLGSKLIKIRQTFDCFPNMQSTDPVAGLIFDMVSDILIEIIREKTPSLTSQDILEMTPEFTQLFFDAYEQLVNFAFSTDILRNLKTELSSRGLNVKWDVYSYYHFCISQIPILLQTMAERV